MNNSLISGLSLNKGIEINVEDLDNQLNKLKEKVQQESINTM